jgi:asparagine synthase (glutamine-hydrolysing)
MAGIFGIVRFDDAPFERDLLARMSRALAHRGPDDEGLHIEGTAAFGCRYAHLGAESHSDPQPVVRSSGTCVVFDGRLDNRGPLITALRAHVDVCDQSPDAAIVAACYDVFGTDFARRLLGDFAVAVLDRRERRLVLARDAIGIRPLYYRRTPSALVFASEVKALLADRQGPVRPNTGLLAQLSLGYLHRHGDDGSTLFDTIEGLPASHVGVFSEARSHVWRYWDFGSHASAFGSFEDYAGQLRHYFSQAVERRLRGGGRIAIAVSGGLDSSSIFCLAHFAAGGTPPVGLTFSTRDGEPSDESAYIAEVERMCGTTIHYLNPPFAGLLSGSDTVVDWTEAPMLDAQWFRGSNLLAAAKAAGASTLLTGDWGDQILFDQAYLVDLLHSGRWRTVRAHIAEYYSWFPDATDEFISRLLVDIFDYDVPSWLQRAIRAVRRPWVRRAAWDDWYSRSFRCEAETDSQKDHLRLAKAACHTRPTILMRALYREVRSRYHALCLEWNNKTCARYGIDYSVPFLDRDLLDFVMSVPGSILVRNGVPKALLREALSGTVPSPILQRRSKGDFTADVNRASRHDYQTIVQMLGSDPFVVQFGYVEADKLQRGLRVIEGALEGSASCTATWALARLVALELWLRRFIGNRPQGGC